MLLPLPEKPEDIPEDAREMLLFEIPIKNRGNLRAILAALRKVYTFAQLQDEYFTELEPLSDNPWEVCDEEGDLPDLYFRLSKKKIPLPLTPQELNHKYRAMFFIDLTRLPRDVKRISTQSKYKFPIEDKKEAIQKPELPWDPRNIGSKFDNTHYINKTASGTDKKHFLEPNLVMRSLQPLYFFHQIPETWIEIKRNQNPPEEAKKNQKEMKIDMPESLK
ncbi:hypothetical protein C2G38_2218803 [Gigaspora rosea]|uniref:Uncharacterized protein n=1 Tax=Gigaspora rosea TaxID=44941 RepID=A0A397UEM9_9GLOM|nr:hypothetical protein C2G38_2218803 [Gigaspora rosea]